MPTITQNIYFRVCLLFIGLFIGLSALTARTLIDARDVEKIVQLKTPDTFKTDPKFEQVYNDIIARPLYLDQDSYYWILYATNLVKNKNFRIRWNNYDNAPYGRAIHWNSGYAWFLVFIGKINSILTKKDLVSGIEHAGRWAGPIIAGLFGTFWGIILSKKFNLLIGCLFPLMFFFFGALRGDMSYAITDHHILHLSLALSQLLAIIIGGAGFIRNKDIPHNTNFILNPIYPPDYKSARRWFLAAALFGAAGIWVGATQQSIIIGLIGAGGCFAALLNCSKKALTEQNSSEVILKPGLWRWWGWTGAGLTVFFYLIEYFPHNLGMRLEVIHPLYGLSWIGGAEIIYRICSARSRFTVQNKKISTFLGMSMPFIALCALPVIILFGPDSWHVVHDPIIRRLHDYIHEFKPIFSPYFGVNIRYILVQFGLYPLCLIIAIIAFRCKFFNTFQRAIIIQAWLPSLILLFFYLFQQRWDGLLGVALIVLSLSIFSAVIQKTNGIKSRAFTVPGLVFIIFIVSVPSWIFLINNDYFPENPDHSITNRYGSFTLILLAREIAINFKALLPNNEVRLLTDNSIAPPLAYYGIRSVGSLYWENGEGIKDYARFFSAYSDSSALDVVNKRNVTHVILPIKTDFTNQIQWSEDFANHAHWTYWGNRLDENVKTTLAYRIALNPADHPEWLKPFPLFYSPFSRLYGMICYRVDLSGK